MREILFRGKCSHKEQWVEGDLGHRKSRFCEAHTVGICDAYGTYVGVIPETVSQFTGLLDKNGKKIFEGDIVKALFDFGPAGTEERVATVTFDGFGISLQHWIFEEKGCLPEIISNIHDNPELLEAVK